jgi:cytochrome c
MSSSSPTLRPCCDKSEPLLSAFSPQECANYFRNPDTLDNDLISLQPPRRLMIACDPAHGEKVFQRCKACHTLEAGTNKIGPSLAGLIGRKAGSVEGFKYSEALASARDTVVWNDQSLDAWLTNPKKFIPGNRMAFPGLPNAQDRADVIAYLHQAAK